MPLKFANLGEFDSQAATPIKHGPMTSMDFASWPDTLARRLELRMMTVI